MSTTHRFKDLEGIASFVANLRATQTNKAMNMRVSVGKMGQEKRMESFAKGTGHAAGNGSAAGISYCDQCWVTYL